ncbi:MAG: hypothetical protein SAL70_41875 [Scytonema sp. PMC 1070.18]|nr:hypothetical protein [Scytonema sp. PMC 1070.18]
MTKGKILQSIWDNLPDDRKECIQARTEELEAERLTLQEHGILSRVKLSMNILER